jgi:spoIIIJ-associated protein
MSAYQEFTGKTVEEALRNARDTFGVGLNDLDFEILTPGSRGVLGMGAELARIVAAPREALGGSAPKREAAQATPLPAPAHAERDDRADRGPRRDDRADRGPRREDRGDRGPRREGGQARPADRARPEPAPTAPVAALGGEEAHGPERAPRPERPPRRDDRAPRPARRDDRAPRPSGDLSEREQAELAATRGSVAAERADLQAAEASPEALQAGREILEKLMELLDFDVRVEIETGDTSRLNVVGDDDEKEALGALIGRKGERLSALQHLVNLMLSRRMGDWTRVLVDVEDYRGRRERQLVEIAKRAAERVLETGKMLQLEPMSALERRWIHIALRDDPGVVTQSVGEEPNRRVVVLPRS